MSTGLTGSRCLCRTCGERFNSVSMFDRHRVGRVDLAAPSYGRRCLTVEEMTERGYSLNAAGFWIERASHDRTRRSDDRQEVLG